MEILTSCYDFCREGVNMKGYFIWTFLDDFEWDLGYTVRFGLTYIDYGNGLQRHLKHSALWFKKFLQNDITTTKSMSSLLYIELVKKLITRLGISESCKQANQQWQD